MSRSSTTSSRRRSTGDGRTWEAVFVDDGSTDGTFGALTRLHDAHDNVRVVRLRRNFGKAAALDAGFGEAAGEIVVTIDGDLQDDPAEIPRLLAKLDEGYDLVSGWKTNRRDPITRRVPVEDLQRRRRQGLRRAPARHELRPQGLPGGGRGGDAAVRRAAPLHPGARPLPRLPRHRAARQPSATRARALELRRRALRARIPRPPHGHVHGPLPPPAAASLRRRRAPLQPARHARSSST